MRKIKLSVVGDGGAGKTSLLSTYNDNDFPDFIIPMTEREIVDMNLGDGGFVLSMWDNSGGEDYDRLRVLTYPGTDIFLITYSCVSPASFENLKCLWYPEITRVCPESQFFIVATKIDLKNDAQVLQRLKEKQQQIITTKQGKELACELGGRFFETSALTGKGVRDVFETACRIRDLPRLEPKKYKEKSEKPCSIN